MPWKMWCFVLQSMGSTNYTFPHICNTQYVQMHSGVGEGGQGGATACPPPPPPHSWT